MADVVGTAFVRIKALTDQLAKDIEKAYTKGLNDANLDKPTKAKGEDVGETFGDSVADSAEKTLKKRAKTLVPEDDITDGFKNTFKGIRNQFNQLDLFGDVSERFDQLELDFDLPELDIDIEPAEEALEEFRQAQTRLARDTDNGPLSRSLDRLAAKFRSLGSSGLPSLGLLRGTILLIGGAIIAALPYIQDVGAAVLAYATGLVAQIGALVTALGGLGVAAGAAIGSAAVAFVPILLAFQAETEFLEHFKESLKDTGIEFQRIGQATQQTLLPALDRALLISERLIPMFSEYGLFVGQAAGQFSVLAAETLIGNEAQGRFQAILQSSLRILDMLFPLLLNVGDVLSGLWVAAIPASERFVGTLDRLVERWSDLINEGLATGTLTETLDTWYERAQLIGGALANLSGALFDILEIGADSSDNLFVRFDEWAERYREFTESEAGQNRLSLIFDNALAVMREINGVAADLFDGIFGRLGEVGGVDSMVEALERFREKLPEIQESWADMYNDIKRVVNIIGDNLFEKLERAAEKLSEPLGRLGTQVLEFLDVMNDSGAFDVFLDLMKILSDTLATLLAIPGFGQFVGYMLAFGAAVKVARIALGPFIGLFGQFISLAIRMVQAKVAVGFATTASGLQGLVAGFRAAKAANVASIGQGVAAASAQAAGGAASLSGSLGGAVAGLGRFAPALGIAGAALVAVGGYFYLNQQATARWEQELRQAEEALGLLNDGLNITSAGITKYITEFSSFSSKDQVRDLEDIGLSVSSLASQITAGTISYEEFGTAVFNAGQLIVKTGQQGDLIQNLKVDESITSMEQLREQFKLTDAEVEQLLDGMVVVKNGTSLFVDEAKSGAIELIDSFTTLNKVLAGGIRENLDGFINNVQNMELLGPEVLQKLKEDIESAGSDAEVIELMVDAENQLGIAAGRASEAIVGLTDATRQQVKEQVAHLSGTERLVAENALLTAEYKKMANQLAEGITLFNSDDFERQFGTAKAAVLDFQGVLDTASRSEFKIEFGDGIDELTRKFPELSGATDALFDSLRTLPVAEFNAAAAQLGVDADVLREAMNNSQQAIIDLQEQALASLPTIGELLDEATQTGEDGSQFFDREGFVDSINQRTEDANKFAMNIEFIRQRLGNEAALMALQQGPEAAANLQRMAGSHPDQLKEALDSMTTAEQSLAKYIDDTFGPLMAQKYAVEAGVISSTFNVSLVGGLADPRVGRALQQEGLKTLDDIARTYRGRFEIVNNQLRFIPMSTSLAGTGRPGNDRGLFLSDGGFVNGSAFGFGPSGTDTVPAWLSPGEFVLRQAVASAIPANVLNSLNDGDPRLVGLLSSLSKNRPGGAAALAAVASVGATNVQSSGGNVNIGQMNIEAPEPLESARMVSNRLKILQSQLTRR